MEFKACTVTNQVYTDSNDNADANQDSMNIRESNCWRKMTNRAVNGRPLINEQEKGLIDFFTLCAVCHSVNVEKEEKSNELIYRASSPDELALV